MQGIGVLSLVCCVISGLVFQAHGEYPSHWFYQDEGAALTPNRRYVQPHHPFREVRHHSGYRRPESRSSYGPLAPSESRASYGPPSSSGGYGRRDYGPREPHRKGYGARRRPHRKPGQSKRYKPKTYKKKEKKCCPTTTARFSVTNSADNNSPLAGVTVTSPSIPQATFVTDENGQVEVEITRKLPFKLDYTASKDDASVMGTAVLNKGCSVQPISESISCISTIIFVVTNADDDSPLADVTISIDSSPPATLVTDADGEDQIEITEQIPSYLEYSASTDGFIEVRGIVTKTCSVQYIHVVMLPIVIVDRTELQWAPGICYMDQYVVEYDDDDGTSCRTFWDNMNGCSDTSLDLDPCGGENSPTTITWRDNAKRYLLYVDQYGCSSNCFINSMAEYRIYGLDGSVVTIPVPTTPAGNTKRYWVLGCFDGPLGLDSLNLLNIFVVNPLIVDCTPLGLESIIPPSATDNWVIEALAQDNAPRKRPE